MIRGDFLGEGYGKKSFPWDRKEEEGHSGDKSSLACLRFGPAWGGSTRGICSRGLKVTRSGFRRPQVLVLDLLVSLDLSFPSGKAPIEASPWPPMTRKAGVTSLDAGLRRPAHLDFNRALSQTSLATCWLGREVGAQVAQLEEKRRRA